jgi:tRNA/rRNA methyltransferase
VLLTGYEWVRAVTDARAPFAMVHRSPAAPRGMVLSFFAYLEGELERAGFFRPETKQPVMRRNLRNMFHRMQLTEQDVRTLRGMVVRLVEGPRAGVTSDDKLPPGGKATPSPDSNDSLARDKD